jgi:DNA-binding beta-propeller fold protein YncE
MPRLMFLAIFLPAGQPAALCVEQRKEAPPPTGILVLDNCDEQYRGKERYNDNLTLVDSAGKLIFRVSGFNNCESIGSSRMIAADTTRKFIWVIENVAHRIRRFDLTGKETLTIDGVHGSAIAVDPATGNVWALVGRGRLGQGRIVVYDPKGKEVTRHDMHGWDIVYDKHARAFWIAGASLTKITADMGKVLFSVPIATWSASSVEVDPQTGAAWVLVRAHPQMAASRNRLLKLDPNGKELVAVELGQKMPFRVSVNPKDGSVWVANFGKSVERFSADGKPQAEFPMPALAVQVAPGEDAAWVVTRMELQKISRKGEVVKRVRHAGKTSQAWIGSLE